MAEMSGSTSGTTNQAEKTLKLSKIQFNGLMAQHFDVYYRVKVGGLGWLDWAKMVKHPKPVGWLSRIEAIQVSLVDKGNVSP